MSSDYDITMNVDETLELDAVIQNWDAKSDDTINVTQGTDYNLNGFQTHTGVFDPQSSGDYTIKVNGQTISIKVKSSITIPDTTSHQFYASGYNGSSSTLKDYASEADLSLNSSLTQTQFKDGGDAISNDISDSTGSFTPDNTMSGNSSSYEFTTQFTTSSTYFTYIIGDGNSKTINISLNNSTGGVTSNGNIRLFVRDDSGDTDKLCPSTTPNLNDGDIHKITVIVNDPASSDYEIIIDGSSKSLTFGTSQSPNLQNTFQTASVLTSQSPIKYGIFRFHNTNITNPTI